jgi:hypothetical protein
VEAPEEIVEPPSPGADGGDLAGIDGDEHAGGVRISIGDPPRRKRATIFGAFVRDA